MYLGSLPWVRGDPQAFVYMYTETYLPLETCPIYCRSPRPSHSTCCSASWCKPSSSSAVTLVPVTEAVVVRARRFAAREAAECVGKDGLTSRAVGDHEVELGQEFCPSDLALVELLGRHEGLEILVVRDDLKGVGGALELGPPLLESFDNREELFIIYLVVTFGSRVLG